MKRFIFTFIYFICFVTFGQTSCGWIRACGNCSATSSTYETLTCALLIQTKIRKLPTTTTALTCLTKEAKKILNSVNPAVMRSAFSFSRPTFEFLLAPDKRAHVQIDVVIILGNHAESITCSPSYKYLTLNVPLANGGRLLLLFFLFPNSPRDWHGNDWIIISTLALGFYTEMSLKFLVLVQASPQPSACEE